MWFGAKPTSSRAAPMRRPLTESELIKEQQAKIQTEISRFIQQEKNRTDLLADRIQDLVNNHGQNQPQRRISNNNASTSFPQLFSSSSSSASPPSVLNNLPTMDPFSINNNTNPNSAVLFSPSPLSSQALLPIHQILQRPPFDRRLASRVNIDVLNCCSNVVKGIDKVMQTHAESKIKANLKSALNNNNNQSSITSSSSSSNKPKSLYGRNNDNDEDDNNVPLGDGKATNAMSTFGSGTSRFSSSTRRSKGQSSRLINGTSQSLRSGKSTNMMMIKKGTDSLLDQEEIDEDLRRLRTMCFDDCFLEDDECSIVDGYGSDPSPAQLGPVSSVVTCVSEIKKDAEKIKEACQKMSECLDECISLRKDMITMRKFKKNCTRANYHARKVTLWANQSRTHMFIFNNTINQVGREAASDLVKGKEKKIAANERTIELMVKLSDAEKELEEMRKKTQELVETHGEVERSLLATYKVRIEEAKASASASSLSSPLHLLSSSVVVGSPTGNNALLGVSSTSSASSRNVLMGSSQANVTTNAFSASSMGVSFANTVVAGKPGALQSAAHRAFDKMSISAVELYLLLHRLVMSDVTTASASPMPLTVSTAIKRIMATIEQSVDIEKLDHEAK